MIDITALKLGLETFEADAVDAYCKAPEHEEVVVGPATEYLERLARAGKDMHVVWRIRPQLRERRSAGQNWAEHLVEILVDKLMSCAVQRRATVSLYSTRHVALELHMDDIHGAASPSGRQQFIKALSRQIDFKGGDRCEWWKKYQHPKRLRTTLKGETRPQPNTKYLESVADQLGLTGSETETDSTSAVAQSNDGRFCF